MTSRDPVLQGVINELADSLQTAVLLASRLAMDLRAPAQDAVVLDDAIRRATATLRRLQPKGGRP
jgi:hypothetical protein